MISVSSKYMVQNTQCIIHGPVGKHVFWANSPKYIVQNEPSPSTGHQGVSSEATKIAKAAPNFGDRKPSMFF